VAGGPKLQKVEDLLKRNRQLQHQPWQRWRVKDGEKGPMVWEVKHLLIYVPDAEGLPGKPWHLLIARNALDHTELKYFISNAPPETTVDVLLLVAFSRWRIERCFEDDKGEIGLDHYEGRRYVGLKRHLVLSAVSLLFLAQTRESLREKNPELTVCQIHLALSAVVRSWWLDGRAAKPLFDKAAEEIA